MGSRNATSFRKKAIHETEVDKINTISIKLETLLQDGKNTLQSLSNTQKTIFAVNFQDRIQKIAEINKNLRERADILEKLENKFKKLGGADWMTSRFYPVICSVRVCRSEIKSAVEESLVLADKLGYYSATLNEKQRDFHEGKLVTLDKIENYVQLNENFNSNNSRHVKQRTERWHEIRNTARVTGSTCYNALGLGKLKDQQKHYDKVILNKVSEEEHSEEERSRLQYGIDHETDAVATVCCKVIPYKYPTLLMFEEGCIKLGFAGKESFMVVSPDGSLRESMNGCTHLAYETKCKSPNSYSISAYYQIPLYYIPQILCEMRAVQSKKLLFTCWAEQSITVFEVENDPMLWESCWLELTNLYGPDCTSRPKHFSEVSKTLKNSIRVFRDNNTKLCAEFPSIRVISGQTSTPEYVSGPYRIPEIHTYAEVEVLLETVLEVLSNLKQWHKETYNHLRCVASEILVFMVSDLNRIYDMENNNAHVVGYAMKGPSMRQSVLRNMMKDVINSCEQQGLSVLITASDGQWHQYGVKDDNDLPLTVHQLQKQVWGKIRSLDKSKLQTRIRNNNTVKSLEDIDFERKPSCIEINGHKHDTSMKFSGMNHQAADNNAISEEDKNDKDNSADGCICEGFDECLDSQTLEEVDRVSLDTSNSPVSGEEYLAESQNKHTGDDEIQITESVIFERPELMAKTMEDEFLDMDDTTMDEKSHDLDISEVLSNAYSVLNDNGIQTPHSGDEQTEVYKKHSASLLKQQNSITVSDALERMEVSSNLNAFDTNDVKSKNSIEIYPRSEIENTCQESVMSKLRRHNFERMLIALQCDEKSANIKNRQNTSVENLIAICESKESMDKCLLKREVYVCAKCIEQQKVDENFHVLCSWPKYRILESLFKEQNITLETPQYRKNRNVQKLKQLCWNQLKSLNKNALAKIIAEHDWNKELLSWKEKSVVPCETSLVNLGNEYKEIDWFSQPRVENGNVRFHFTDACHLLTCIRTKLCTTGIEGLAKTAWEIAALSKDTKLNITIVVDCVDKQDVALARRVFAEDVESVLQKHNFVQEAKFCRLIREWFDAEDEPSLSAIERCRRRLELRKWLLEGYRIGKFPPHTRYVKGIPIVTYEALITHLERKIQLFAYVPDSKYNVRATGTQEVEQFFSAFKDMDPSGSGTPKPDVIPEMIAAALEIDNFKLDPQK